MTPFYFNIFRILGDLSHTASKFILIWAIHSNRSAEGVSLLTQVLYAIVFFTRYIDLFWAAPFADWGHTWNFFLKLFYITTSLYIIYVMMRVFARTREREKAWKLGTYSLFGSLVGAPLVYLIFRKFYSRGHFFSETVWTFSEILESVAVLPQLLLLRQTTVPTVIDSYYLVTLGSYRALYILNWIYRVATEVPKYRDPISWIFGTIQTALFIDFGWVYYTRQRVKLRHGGIVDSDDLSRGWLVGRVLGRKSTEIDEEGGRTDGDQNSRGAPGGRWGARGVSVSADEGVHDVHKQRGRDAESQPLTDPMAFEDDLDDEDDIDDVLAKAPRKKSDDEHASGVSGGQEWEDQVK